MVEKPYRIRKDKGMKKIWFVSLLCAVMLFSAYAIAEDQGGTRITDALMQAGITEPVQLSQWQHSLRYP